MFHPSSSIAVLCLAVPASFAVQVESLGPGPGSLFSPTLISDNGEVIVGGARELTSSFKVGVWTQATALVVLDAGTPDKFYPFRMSADGSRIIGRQSDVGPNLLEQGIVWDVPAGTRTVVGLLPGAILSTATGISADGSTVVGGSYGPTAGAYQAYRWTQAGGTQPLAPPAIFFMAPQSVNGDGSVIVGSTIPNFTSSDSRAAIWSATGGLSTVPGLPNALSEVTGVSNDGLSMVGLVDDPAFPSGVFYYSAGLGVLPVDLGNPGLTPTTPPQISADGSTILVQPTGPPVKWSPATGAETFGPSGFWFATSISSDGSTVAGYRAPFPTSNDRQAFRWESSGQVVLLDPITPGETSIGNAISGDGSAICGGSVAAFSIPVGQGARWRTDGTIGESYCGPAVPNSTGASAELRLSGSNVIDQGELVLLGSGLPSFTFGFFLVAPNSAFVTGVPGSQGNLCLGGAIGRFVGPGQVQQSNGSGEFSLTVDPRALPSPLGTFSAPPGENLYFQAWFRDANPNGTSNFTSGATVRFY